MSKEDKIDVLALYDVDWKIQSVNNYEAQKKAERRSRRLAKRGRSLRGR